MSWLEALRYAKDISGLTAEEIAARMFVKPSIVRRYLQNADGYAPGLDKLPALCTAMDNAVLLEWLEAQLERQPEDVPPARSRAEVLTAVAPAWETCSAAWPTARAAALTRPVREMCAV